VTVSVVREAAQEWLDWMRVSHIPDVLATGCFESHELSRVVEPAPEAGSEAWEIRYTCRSPEMLARYRETAAAALQRDHSERFAGRVTASRRVLDVLES
jgi:hypothetical protein